MEYIIRTRLDIPVPQETFLVRSITHKLGWLLLAVLAVMAPLGAQPSNGSDAPRAVIVVGPVDPPTHVRTRKYVREAEQVATILEESGYRVTRVYHPNATWDKLCKVSRGANIFVYYGHGNGYGWMGYTAPDEINGLCLDDPEDPEAIVAGPDVPGGSAAELQKLGLAPDCTVALVHTCYATGSSTFDRQAANFDTASQRVGEYAKAFFGAGAARYLATSYEGVTPDYFRKLTAGQTPEQAFGELMQGTQTYANREMVLAKASDGPKDPFPWVAALVNKPTVVTEVAQAAPIPITEVVSAVPKEIALAVPSAQETSAQHDQPATQEYQTGWFGNRVIMSALMPPRNQEEFVPFWSGWHDAERWSEGQIGQESILFRSLDGRRDSGNDLFDRYLGYRDARRFDDLFARLRG
jgi:hypothetical protein